MFILMFYMILFINAIAHTIKMKPLDVKPDSYAEYNVASNEKDAKFKVGDHGRIWKYKNIFAKEYAPNWSEEDFVIRKIKKTVPWANVIINLNREEVLRTFYEEDLQKNRRTIKKNLE